MDINWKPGKTEAIIVYRGIGATSAKQGLAERCSVRCFHVPGACSNDPDVFVNVVSSYKHLGSIIDETASYVPEANNRSSKAMNSFAPLAVRVLGSLSISRNRRIRLSWSLVMSRLLFNVHVWSCFAGKARTTLNVTYMRVWRRVAGNPRYERTSWTDLDIRIRLQVPSIDCIVRKRRLCYLARVAKCKFDALHAALQAFGPKGQRMPWIDLIIEDITVLKGVESQGPRTTKVPRPVFQFRFLLAVCAATP